MERDERHDRAMKMALRLLSIRPRSIRELRAKLSDRNIEPLLLEKVIEKLLDLNYLDDAEFAGQYTRHLAFNLLYGNRRIEAALREKGVPEEAIKSAISANREELDEKEAIRRILYKKINLADPRKLDLRQRAKLARMLAGRGFPTGLIYEALRKPQEDME